MNDRKKARLDPQLHSEYVCSNERGDQVKIFLEDGVVTSVTGKIIGDPKQLQSATPMVGSPLVYNPKREMNLSRALLMDLIGDLIPAMNHVALPIFPVGSTVETATPLTLFVKFRMERPQAGCAITAGTVVKNEADPSLAVHQKEVGNLCAFLLGVLTGPLYDDDTQISALHVIRARNGNGDGSTSFYLRAGVDMDIDFLDVNI